MRTIRINAGIHSKIRTFRRSVLVAHHRRFGQRHVAIRIRTRCARGATVARRNVAIGFAASVAFGPRSLIAGTRPAKLAATAVPTGALPATTAGTTVWAVVAIAARGEIAAGTARRAGGRGRHGPKRETIGIALRLLTVEVDALALRARSVAGILATVRSLVLATVGARVRAAEVALAPVLAGRTQADRVGIALRLHGVKVRTSTALALRARTAALPVLALPTALTLRTLPATALSLRTRTTTLAMPPTAALSFRTRAALTFDTLALAFRARTATLSMRTRAAALSGLTRPTLAMMPPALLAMRTRRAVPRAFVTARRFGRVDTVDGCAASGRWHAISHDAVFDRRCAFDRGRSLNSPIVTLLARCVSTRATTPSLRLTLLAARRPTLRTRHPRHTIGADHHASRLHDRGNILSFEFEQVAAL